LVGAGACHLVRSPTVLLLLVVASTGLVAPVHGAVSADVDGAAAGGRGPFHR